MFTVQRYPYCGLSMPAHEFDNEPDARSYVAEMLTRLRRKFPVVVLTRGQEWEVCEPDGAAMVPDACGTITLEHVQPFECKECGCYHDTIEQSWECCEHYPSDDEDDNG